MFHVFLLWSLWFLCFCWHSVNKCVLVAQLCLTLCNPMDYSQPGLYVHGTLEARILDWVAIPFSRGSSWPRDLTWVSCIAGRFFAIWATRQWVLLFLLLILSSVRLGCLRFLMLPDVHLYHCFPLITAFAVSHRLWLLVFSLIWVFSFFFNFALIPSVVHCVFSSEAAGNSLAEAQTYTFCNSTSWPFPLECLGRMIQMKQTIPMQASSKIQTGKTPERRVFTS